LSGLAPSHTIRIHEESPDDGLLRRRGSLYGEYRPWRTGLAANVERTFAMVS
jgi:hypothetical protein